MNILSLNIACLPRCINIIGNIYKRLELIQLLLKKLNPNIILLQEVFSNYSRNILYQFFKEHKYNVLLSPYNSVYLNGGLLIATKHRIITSNYYTYKNCFGEDSLSCKGILYAQLVVKRKVIHLFNTHNNNIKPSFSLHKNTEIIYKKQLKELINYIYYIKKKYKSYNKIINSTNISYILAGDFNLNHNSKLYHYIINRLKKHYKVCTNKKEIITDNLDNTQVDYIINCYDKKIKSIPYSKTMTIPNLFISDHNTVLKYIS